MINRYIFEKGKTVVLLDDNIDKYVGKNVKLRSPMTCSMKNGVCYKCCDYIWELKNLQILNVVPASISSTILMTSMKAFHGTKVNIYEIKSLNMFIY